MKNLLITFIAVLLLNTACSDSNIKSFEVVLKNQTNMQLTDQYVEVDLSKVGIMKETNELNFLVKIDNKEIPSQKVEDNKIGFVTDFRPKEEKIAVVEYGNQLQPQKYDDRTYAEISMKVDYNKIDGKYSGGRFQNFEKLRVPDDHTDHNALFKYEGPGWESDKVGYRIYIDWRNRTDIFGKKTHDLVLKNVGINDLEAEEDSYHTMQDWGKDIFKVGNSLGIGSFGMMVNNETIMVSERDNVFVEITENGPVKSNIKIDYYGWKVDNSKYDLEANLSITAGSRLTEVKLKSTGNPNNFVTGLAKHPGTEFQHNFNEGEWSYISVYGVQTIADYGQPDEPVDNLGIAVFFKNTELIEQTETEDSYVVVLKPSDGKLKYYFAAAWEQEPNGIKSKEEFYQYLSDVVKSLNNPIILKYK